MLTWIIVGVVVAAVAYVIASFVKSQQKVGGTAPRPFVGGKGTVVSAVVDENDGHLKIVNKRGASTAVKAVIEENAEPIFRGAEAIIIKVPKGGRPVVIIPANPE